MSAILLPFDEHWRSGLGRFYAHVEITPQPGWCRVNMDTGYVNLMTIKPVLPC